jgi:hypothetical protein
MARKSAKEGSEDQKEDAPPSLPPMPVAENTVPQPVSTNDDPKLLMRVVTWLRDSHALFDYESRQIQKKNLKIEKSCKFVRVDNDVKTMNPTESLGEEQASKLLFTLNKSDTGEYSIDTDSTQSDKLWLVVRAMKNESEKLSYELKKNDIVKLGRIQFRVKDLQTDTITKNDTKDLLLNEDMEIVRSVITSNTDDKNPDAGDPLALPQCRFCWENECSKERPLINACKCTGTMKYIHLQCLKMWVKSKVKPISNEKLKDSLESFIWKTFECEVCKKKYPYTLKHGEDQYYNIFDIDIPDGPFCILESLSIDKNSSRMIFIMKPTKEQMEFRVGRGHDSDIRVSDIS